MGFLDNIGSLAGIAGKLVGGAAAPWLTGVGAVASMFGGNTDNGYGNYQQALQNAQKYINQNDTANQYFNNDAQYYTGQENQLKPKYNQAFNNYTNVLAGGYNPDSIATNQAQTAQLAQLENAQRQNAARAQAGIQENAVMNGTAGSSATAGTETKNQDYLAQLQDQDTMNLGNQFRQQDLSNAANLSNTYNQALNQARQVAGSDYSTYMNNNNNSMRTGLGLGTSAFQAAQNNANQQNGYQDALANGLGQDLGYELNGEYDNHIDDINGTGSNGTGNSNGGITPDNYPKTMGNPTGVYGPTATKPLNVSTTTSYLGGYNGGDNSGLSLQHPLSSDTSLVMPSGGLNWKAGGSGHSFGLSTKNSIV